MTCSGKKIKISQIFSVFFISIFSLSDINLGDKTSNNLNCLDNKGLVYAQCHILKETDRICDQKLKTKALNKVGKIVGEGNILTLVVIVKNCCEGDRGYQYIASQNDRGGGGLAKGE